MGKKIKIRKVSTEALLDIISHLYDKGVDYVDFDGYLGDDVDTLGLSFGKNYMDPEYVDDYDTLFPEPEPEEEENTIEVKKLTDEDLNQIL